MLVVDPWPSVFAGRRVFGNRFLESYRINPAKLYFLVDVLICESFRNSNTVEQKTSGSSPPGAS